MKNFSQFSLSLEKEKIKVESALSLIDLSYSTESYALPNIEKYEAFHDNEYLATISTEDNSVKDSIISFFNKLFELMKKIWNNFTSYLKSFGKMLKAFAMKIRDHAKMIFSKKKVVIKLKDGLVEEATKLQENKVKKDEDLKNKATALAEMVDKKTYFEDVEDVSDVKRRLNTLLDDKVEYENVDLTQLKYSIPKEDFHYFGYNHAFGLLDDNLLRYHTTVANHSLQIALEMRRIFDPKRLIDSIMSIGKQYNKIDVDLFRTKLLEDYLEEVKPLYQHPKLQGNLSNTLSIRFKSSSQSNDKNKLIEFREDVRKTIPVITEADQSEFMKYQEKYFEYKHIENYLKLLEQTVKEIERNRQHLENDNHEIITQGVMMNKMQLNKLLRDSDIERKAINPKRTGKDILNFTKDMSTTALNASQVAVQIYAKQCSLFNKQISSLLKLVPELKLN